MIRKVTKIRPWQAAKVFALIYFMIGLVFAIPLTLVALFVTPGPGQQQVGLGFALGLPFIYGIGGLVFVPLACWVYNFAAKLVGGLEVEVHTSAET